MKRLLLTLTLALCLPLAAHAEPAPAEWRLLDDPQLDGLIAEALAANPDVRTAAARLTLAEAEFDSTRAARRPELSLNAGGERRSYSRQERRDDPSLKSPASTLTLGAAASYEVDLWGRLAKAAEAGRAETLASAADLDAARLSIAAEVATAWFSLRGELVKTDLLARRQAAARQQLALLQQRQIAGLIGADEIAAHRSTLAQLDAEQAEHTRLIAAWRHRLAALLGQSTATEPLKVETTTWPELSASASLTTELIGQRPDVRAAYARVAAHQARVGSAKAARLPSLNLTANGLFSSNSLRDLLNSGSLAGWLAGQINLPLFDGGRRKARVRTAEAELSVGMADYTATTVRAFQETADALTSVETAHDRLIAAQADVAARRQRLSLAQARLDAGVSDRIALLDAAIAQIEAERDVARARLNQTLAGIGLGRALATGFGLDNSSPVIAQNEIAAIGHGRPSVDAR
ncbi:MAG: efflux transporter outer membrane subunit [Opitutus sp.]|nr:efflux transporter outer membrane subunit [Opitutus sp.]MCS6248467.1 efflux transporter outer membrane subunit [Opitutus sp.]MCS6274449.1 efflux transporter outer membrane subunit [Opitutus sp.]MCS6277595.1 efflux transporter outer membrane subunit [Opitutus sp.]MCS6300713.1 efflux transporter outer membrane subunit [Opitutus sp.]